jgi:DNA-3-methyladenine glycosylase
MQSGPQLQRANPLIRHKRTLRHVIGIVCDRSGDDRQRPVDISRCTGKFYSPSARPESKRPTIARDGPMENGLAMSNPGRGERARPVRTDDFDVPIGAGERPATALPRAFYDRDTIVVARELLGQRLVHVSNGIERVGRIVEVEAYLGPHDLAAHSSKGRTERTKVMFGPPGYAYVYLVYGLHCCMNVVTEREGHASAVLVRALEPLANVSGKTQGPGLLCKAMNIDRRLNGHDLVSRDFYVAPPAGGDRVSIVRARRIGVEYAKHWANRLLRFYIKDCPFVSRR